MCAGCRSQAFCMRVPSVRQYRRVLLPLYAQPVQSRATHEIVQATWIFSHYNMSVEIVCIPMRHLNTILLLMRHLNTILLKYQIDQINDQKSGFYLFDACDPSFEPQGQLKVQLK